MLHAVTWTGNPPASAVSSRCRAVRYCIRRRFPRHGAGGFDLGGGLGLAFDVGAQAVGQDDGAAPNLAGIHFTSADQVEQPSAGHSIAGRANGGGNREGERRDLFGGGGCMFGSLRFRCALLDVAQHQSPRISPAARQQSWPVSDT